MSQGLFNEDGKEEDEAESDDEHEGVPSGPVRAVDRKTKQQRRKDKEQEEEVRANDSLFTVQTTLFSIINTITGKYCSVGFI